MEKEFEFDKFMTDIVEKEESQRKVIEEQGHHKK